MAKLTDVENKFLLTLYDFIHSGPKSDTPSFRSVFRAANIAEYELRRAAVFESLKRHGYIKISYPFQDSEKKENGKISKFLDTGVSLTDLGRMAAIRILEENEPKSFIEKVHSLNWATWGGMAAIVAAVASALGAYFAYKALINA